jgi:hypothetical protein
MFIAVCGTLRLTEADGDVSKQQQNATNTPERGVLSIVDFTCVTWRTLKPRKSYGPKGAYCAVLDRLNAVHHYNWL